MASFLKSKMVKVCIAEVILAIIVVSVYLYYQNNQPSYEPFAITSNGLEIDRIETEEVMEGTPGNDLMIADPGGSKIFAKGGLNYVIANAGPDELYYSLCSTKIIDNKVNVIEGFDPKQDKLKIFCMGHEVRPESINIIHSKFEGMKITYVEIKGNHSDTAIALLGDIEIEDAIILNERWSSVLKH